MFLSGLSLIDIGNSRDSRGSEGTIFICVYYFDLPASIPTFACIFTVRWLPQIFNRTSCNYQAATWWDLPSYWITIWLIHYGMYISVCLLNDITNLFCRIIVFWDNTLTPLRSPLKLNFTVRYKPFLLTIPYHRSLFIPTEKIRKQVFWCLQGVLKKIMGMKRFSVWF